ncbi:MAG TPA: hypothetical protein VMT15_13325 [Bryobacteraceae bacterium]|nr:hypothetical protein [Bryobacteraceae bacterium]
MRFLAPMLALAAFGLPARASVVAYCDAQCGANTIAAFNSLTGGLATATPSTFSSGNISQNGSGLSQYLDPATGLLFIDENYNSLNLVGVALDLGAWYDSAQIVVPVGITAVVVNLSAGGSGQAYTINGTSILFSAPTIQVGFYDPTGNLGTLSFTHGSGGPLQFNSFSVAGGSDTPEVGTMLLIGSGLFAMRWVGRFSRRFFHSPQAA